MVDRRLVRILKNISILLQIKGENPFKVKAYENAANLIEANQIDVVNHVKNGTLGEIKGFGEALVKKITEYVETGKISFYEKLTQEIPESLVLLTKLPSVGPKSVKELYEKLGIKDLDDLERACLENKVASLKGFSHKTQEVILNGIQHLRAWRGKKQQFECLDYAEEISKKLSELPFVTKFSLSGEIRRVTEVITSINFVVEVEELENAVAKLLHTFEGSFIPALRQIIFTSELDIPVIFDICSAKDFVWRLHNTTASEDYISYFKQYLQDNFGVDFQPLEIPSIFGERILQSEEELFDSLKLQFIPPELRESRYALEKAKSFSIPRLIEDSDLKGMLHVHSNWSDGFNSIEEMALMAKSLGFEYIAICDHSQSAKYANGLEFDRVLEQHRLIDELNQKDIGIKIIKGIESDILADGSLDYSDDELAHFEFVVASVHSNFKMPEEAMTRRMSYALMSPMTHVLGHPTGRLLLAREPYRVDIETIIETAARYGKAIEFNANPYRLDIPWKYLPQLAELSVKVSIGPDSHDVFSLKDIFYGVKFLRKGWLTKEDVINCLNYDEFRKYLKKIGKKSE